MSKDKNKEENETFRYVVGAEHNGVRIDKAISLMSGDLSRARVQPLIEAGRVYLNGLLCTNVSRKLAEGSIVEIEVPPPTESNPEPENIPLDVLYEDHDVIVINKPAGLVVHPGAGNWEGTLVNALLYHCGDSLSGIGGVVRPGIVHRLDKDTSGVMIAAKNDKAHQGLSAQLEDRSLSRVYQALVLKVPVPPKGAIDQPLGRHPSQRLKMAVRRRDGKEARTHYHMKKSYGSACSLVECKLESGRTHQIRVHMESIKHCLIGDPLYGPQPTAVTAAMKIAGYEQADIDAVLAFPRQALHAQHISFIHPLSGIRMNFEAEFPEDLVNLLKILDKKLDA